MRGLGTDHVIVGPMRGLKKMHPMAQTNRQTSGHRDSMTESAQWGRFSENHVKILFPSSLRAHMGSISVGSCGQGSSGLAKQ